MSSEAGLVFLFNRQSVFYTSPLSPTGPAASATSAAAAILRADVKHPGVLKGGGFDPNPAAPPAALPSLHPKTDSHRDSDSYAFIFPYNVDSKTSAPANGAL